MKSLLSALAIFAAMVLPAQADVLIEDLLVRRMTDSVNIRVSITNSALTRQPGPVQVDLYVRATEEDEWINIRTWNNIASMGPGHRISRDFFEENHPLLRDLAALGRFQVRASVKAPNFRDAVEKTSWYNSESGR